MKQIVKPIKDSNVLEQVKDCLLHIFEQAEEITLFFR